MNKQIGIYIHIPFCAKKCPYCDFYSVGYNKTVVDKYTNCIISEILSYKDKDIAIDTIYFGGGTPSLLSEEQLFSIIKAVKLNFIVDSEVEITLEANPNTLNRKRLEGFLRAGINRLSIGVQSFDDNELKSLGRLHSSAQAQNAIMLANECGFKNISVDIMLGTPYQTKKSFGLTLNTITHLPVDHISAYMLTVEEGTPYYNSEIISYCVDEDTLSDMYLETIDFLKKVGFYQYEISNFSKKGFESRHNLKYWQCEEYIGVGAAAHSYLNDIRFFNPPDISSYIEMKQKKVITDDNAGSPEEWLMLGLRLNKGISLAKAKKYFANDAFMLKIQKLLKLEYIKLSDNKKILSLTEKGMLMSNTVISELIAVDTLS